MALCRVSNKCYIGKTKDFNKRKYFHFNNAFRLNKNQQFKFNNKFSKAIRKYGISAFEWFILYNNIPEKQICGMEKFVIGNYNSYFVGYNGTPGGDGGDTFSGRSHSKETKQLQSSIRKKYFETHDSPTKGKKASLETRQKMSIAKTLSYAAAGNPFFGKHHSEESKKKISLYRKGKKHTESTKLKISQSRKGC